MAGEDEAISRQLHLFGLARVALLRRPDFLFPFKPVDQPLQFLLPIDGGDEPLPVATTEQAGAPRLRDLGCRPANDEVPPGHEQAPGVGAIAPTARLLLAGPPG